MFRFSDTSSHSFGKLYATKNTNEGNDNTTTEKHARAYSFKPHNGRVNFRPTQRTMARVAGARTTDTPAGSATF